MIEGKPDIDSVNLRRSPGGKHISNIEAVEALAVCGDEVAFERRQWCGLVSLSLGLADIVHVELGVIHMLELIQDFWY